MRNEIRSDAASVNNTARHPSAMVASTFGWVVVDEDQFVVLVFQLFRRFFESGWLGLYCAELV